MTPISYRAKAHKLWGHSAYAIEGDGPFALVLECRDLVVRLYSTRAEATSRLYPEFSCGGECPPETRGSRHYVVNLQDRSNRRIYAAWADHPNHS